MRRSPTTSTTRNSRPKDTSIEEYITDPLKTAEDKLVINVYVPLK